MIGRVRIALMVGKPVKRGGLNEGPFSSPLRSRPGPCVEYTSAGMWWGGCHGHVRKTETTGLRVDNDGNAPDVNTSKDRSTGPSTTSTEEVFRLARTEDGSPLPGAIFE